MLSEEIKSVFFLRIIIYPIEDMLKYLDEISDHLANGRKW